MNSPVRRFRNPPKKPLTKTQKKKLFYSKAYKKSQDRYINMNIRCFCEKISLEDLKDEFYIFFINISEKFDRSSLSPEKTLTEYFFNYINKRIQHVSREAYSVFE